LSVSQPSTKNSHRLSLPNIVSQIPLEDLDWVVDCRHQKLIPNPEHKHGELSDEF
jgi:hypothetical protein